WPVRLALDRYTPHLTLTWLPSSVAAGSCLAPPTKGCCPPSYQNATQPALAPDALFDSLNPMTKLCQVFTTNGEFQMCRPDRSAAGGRTAVLPGLVPERRRMGEQVRGQRDGAGRLPQTDEGAGTPGRVAAPHQSTRPRGDPRLTDTGPGDQRQAGTEYDVG